MDNWQPITTLGGNNEGDHLSMFSSSRIACARMDRAMHLAIKTYLVIVSALLTLGNVLFTTNF
jgi:hypothetical protein